MVVSARDAHLTVNGESVLIVPRDLDLAAAIESVRQFGRAMVQIRAVMAAEVKTIDRFSLLLQDVLEEAYIKAHGTLPGSERTKRLRKKRRTMVMRWWESSSEEDAHDA